MEALKDIVKLLKEEGYQEGHHSLADFWFENKAHLTKVVDAYYPGNSKAFELMVRWQLPIGVAASHAFRAFLEEKANWHSKRQVSRKWMDGRDKNPYAKLDLAEFYFAFEGQVMNLEDLENAFPSNQVFNLYDLRGFDFSGMHLNGMELQGAAFNFADFRRAHLINCSFLRCALEDCDFRQSTCISVRLCDESSLDGSDFSSAYVNGLENLNNLNLKEPIKFNKVSYMWLVSKTLQILLGARSKLASFTEHTDHSVFLNNELVELSLSQTAAMKDYVLWYQMTINTMSGLNRRTFAEKLSFFVTLLFTKNWSSYVVLAFLAFVINVFFALLYYFMEGHFAGLHGDMIKAFYFSVVTFTTLGYGDVIPLTSLARALVVVEVITGYIMSGIFIFLVGHLVGKRM